MASRANQLHRLNILAIWKARGIYLPLDVATPILAGGLVAEFVSHWHAKNSPPGEQEKRAQNGMLFAAGLITGEALVGIVIAICIWISKNPDVLGLGYIVPAGKWVAALLLFGVCFWIFRAGTPRRSIKIEQR